MTKTLQNLNQLHLKVKKEFYPSSKITPCQLVVPPGAAKQGWKQQQHLGKVRLPARLLVVVLDYNLLRVPRQIHFMGEELKL